jgi:hypothetical protein
LLLLRSLLLLLLLLRHRQKRLWPKVMMTTVRSLPLRLLLLPL